MKDLFFTAISLIILSLVLTTGGIYFYEYILTENDTTTKIKEAED